MIELTITQAEQLVDKRLDRRRKYATRDDGAPDENTGAILFEICRWTSPCSGCHETIDGHELSGTPHDKNGIGLGGGCSECGYTGKRRMVIWVPVDLNEMGE